jgi:DNA polymerase-3 subunit epsilon
MNGRHEFESLESAAEALERSGEYQVLRRLNYRQRYSEPTGARVRSALVLDTETTGLDPRNDRIIELAFVRFTYEAETGRILEVQEPVSYLEDPGRPIPANITDLTGITDSMVQGTRIDEESVGASFAGADLVIAHHAGFDRPFVDQRLSFSRGKPWACSLAEVPWQPAGYATAKLEYLLIKKCGMFFDGHRAANDCLALVHLLATPFDDGVTPLHHLLRSARRKSARIWAMQSPFEVKDLLKARGYRWSSGEDGRPKAWWREVFEEERDAELDWLKENAYGAKPGPWRVDELDARSRYALSV